MKRCLPMLAAALALTACAAAPAETAPAETAPPAESVTEESAQESSFPVGELRVYDDWRRDTDTAYFTIYSEEGTADLVGLRLDYADGVQTKMWTLARTPMYSDWYVTNDNVVRVFLTNEDGSQFRYKSFYPDGRTEEQEISREILPTVYDEYAAYVLRDKTVTRLDWQTGEITQWDASLSQIAEVYGAVGDKVLISRIISDIPLPTEDEMYYAVLQNSRREYDLYDIASNTVEKLFDDAYYPEDGGSWKIYLGCRGDILYFTWSKPADNGCTQVLWGYDLAADAGQELYAEKSTECVGGYNGMKGFSRGGQLQCVFLQSTPDTLFIYKTDDGKVYNVPYHDPTLDAAYGTAENYGCPIALTGDGRMLVTDGYTRREGYPVDAYGLIGLDAYLAGSTEYTPVKMWEP